MWALYWTIKFLFLFLYRFFYIIIIKKKYKFQHQSLFLKEVTSILHQYIPYQINVYIFNLFWLIIYFPSKYLCCIKNFHYLIGCSNLYCYLSIKRNFNDQFQRPDLNVNIFNGWKVTDHFIYLPWNKVSKIDNEKLKRYHRHLVWQKCLIRG